jgi:hypothetical protein
VLTKEDKRDVAEIVAAVVSGLIGELRAQPAPLPPDASDPRSALAQMRKGGPPHEVRSVTGMLKLYDGSHSTYRGTGKVLGPVPATLTVDFTKHPSGVITELQWDTRPAVEFCDAEFRQVKAQAYADSADSPEHLQDLEKQRIKYVQANNYFRFTAHVLNALIGKSIEDPEVALLFTPDPPVAAAAAE